MARELRIQVNEGEVGRLSDADDIWTLEYSDAWRHAADAFDLSPALPRTHAIHRDGATSRPVQWYFDNLLPEEALRTVLAREARLPAEDAFGLLAYYGAESAGAQHKLLVVQQDGNLYEHWPSAKPRPSPKSRASR